MDKADQKIALIIHANDKTVIMIRNTKFRV